MHQIEDTENPRPSRREFCVHACQAASFLAAGGLLQACSGNSMSPSGSTALPTVNASAAAGALTLTVDAASPLATVGSAALVQSSAGNALVSRTAQDTFTAVTAVCTHEGCPLGWNPEQRLIRCPCHGGAYDVSGQVVDGPPPAPLHRLEEIGRAHV